jgi:D-alanyl-lipoteichoic acid acyltransferase DltB (MBOAT superfamily)
VYADFSGYSDMAIGVGKLLGFSITRNFNNPFFALNVADFWRRWHMSLTSWITDYVFTPLSFQFRRWGKAGMILAIIINMVVVGLWHGANWTFVVFGLYHGLLFVPLVLSGAFMKKDQLKTNKIGLPVLEDLGRMLLTFALVVFGVVIFRAESIGMAWEYVCGIVNGSLFTMPILYVGTKKCLLLVFVLLLAEWLGRRNEHPMQYDSKFPEWLKVTITILLVLVMLEFASSSQSFIYFQF